jgi:hypothetical protein
MQSTDQAPADIGKGEVPVLLFRRPTGRKEVIYAALSAAQELFSQTSSDLLEGAPDLNAGFTREPIMAVSGSLAEDVNVL